MAANEYSKELRKKPAGGDMGFGQIFDDPRLNQASTDLAGTTGYDPALAMMAAGREQAVPYGGKKSWASAAAEGLKTGIGMYNFLNTQKAKQQAIAEQLRAYKEKYAQPEATAPEAGQMYDQNGIPLTAQGGYAADA